MKVLLVNDTTDWYHFGCTGTSLILKDEIKKLGHTVASMPIFNCMNLNNAPQNIAEFLDNDLQAKFISTNELWFAKIKNADIIVINGEGTLHGAKKGPLALLLIAYLAKTKFAKNVQIINHSVYPHDDLSTEASAVLDIYKLVYQSLDYVAIREPLSLKLMQSLGLKVHASFDCLPIYIKDFYKITAALKQDNLILLSGSAAWFQANVFLPGAKPEFDVLDGLKKLITILQDKIAQGYEVKFLQSGTTNPAQDDIEMIAFLKDQMQDRLSVILAPTLDAWLHAIQSAGLLISGRFHHSIAATCLGTKFVALNSNTPKVLGLMSALGFKAPLIYGDKKLADKLLQDIANPMQCADNTAMLDKLCNSAHNNFVGLKL